MRLGTLQKIFRVEVVQLLMTKEPTDYAEDNFANYNLINVKKSPISYYFN